uniref:Uncharacterized protein n=1 Tax=Arundo donax TaxID=35708 RepID=A0A0A9C6S7_ARUDO
MYLVREELKWLKDIKID